MGLERGFGNGKFTHDLGVGQSLKAKIGDFEFPPAQVPLLEAFHPGFIFSLEGIKKDQTPGFLSEKQDVEVLVPNFAVSEELEAFPCEALARYLLAG